MFMAGALAERLKVKVADDHVRSSRSFAFEELWRSLRNGKLIPDREDFPPARARWFLSDMALLEVSFDQPLLRIRLAGTRVEERIQRTIGGDNYLDFLSPEFQAGALLSGRLMVSHPCGLWQLTKIHYERGTAQLTEQTVFPLGPGKHGVPMLLVLTNPKAAFEVPTLKADKAIVADTATKWEFLDLGRGVPEWPQ
jgi:hypothetical protein